MVGSSGESLPRGPLGTWEVLSPPSMNPALDKSGENARPGVASCVCGSKAPRRSGTTAKRRKRSDTGGAAGSRSASQYQRSGITTDVIHA